MSERMLITKTELGTTKRGKPQAGLYGKNPAFVYPVLYLQDLSLLGAVGIDPNTAGEKAVYLRYWAYYEISERINSEGNHYKDVLYLEAINNPASATSTDNTAILQELRAIHSLLQQLLSDGPLIPQAPPVRATDRSPSPAAPTPVGATGRSPSPAPTAAATPLSENDARTEFYELAGPAIGSGKLPATAINDIIKLANGNGWNASLAEIRRRLR